MGNKNKNKSVDVSSGVNSKSDSLAIKAKVTEHIRGSDFRVLTEDNRSIVVRLSGKISLNKIKVLIGDIVTVELSPYNLSSGRITYRHKDEDFKVKE